MDSGIYRLTYRNGDTYIGKSKHLTTRWKQHFDKLEKGTAAKNMMDAYIASGRQFPQTEVLVYCHTDLLDYYEGFFINYYKPPLNTQIPELLSPAEQQALIDFMNRDLQHNSVVTMMKTLELYADEARELKQAKAELVDQVAELEDDYEELDRAWGDRARRDAWASAEYREVAGERDSLGQEVKELKSWRLRVERANWWKRLWRLW